MGVQKLDDHWEDLPRVAPMARKPHSLRAHESKNPLKFTKSRRSLARLPAESTMHRNRLLRVMQLSTNPAIRLAPHTVRDGVARPIDVHRHDQRRLMQERSRVESMSAEELGEAREYVRRLATWERIARVAPEALFAAYDDEQLGKAEAFAAAFDSIERTTHDGASNVELIDMPWNDAGYLPRQ